MPDASNPESFNGTKSSTREQFYEVFPDGFTPYDGPGLGDGN